MPQVTLTYNMVERMITSCHRIRYRINIGVDKRPSLNIYEEAAEEASICYRDTEAVHGLMLASP